MDRRRKIFLIIANFIICLFIFSKIKILLYRVFLGYKISFKSQLGLFSFIVAKTVYVEDDVKIKPFSIILDCDNVSLLKGARIYRFAFIHGLKSFTIGMNSIVGANTIIYGRFSDRLLLKVEDGGNFSLGLNSVIGNKHYYDLSGNITIGNNVVIGGTQTQFFTHGYDCYRNFSYGNITIGDDCYIGTSVLVLAGITIASETVIAAGTVVCKSCKEKGVYGGNPIRMIKTDPRISYSYIEK